MPSSDQRAPRAWVRDPRRFGLALVLLACVTIALAVGGRVSGDPTLFGLAAFSVLPAFWLFYQRGRALAGGAPIDRPRRR